MEDTMKSLSALLILIFVVIIMLMAVKSIQMDESEDDKRHTLSKVGIYVKGHKKRFILVGSAGFLLLLLWLVQYMP